MPRPGPRQYDCVRRGWHSERHQPIRGTLIQEIFRVVDEIHGSATKKNKEYQEKLPIVVLRAEEILYSKAISEAEYMDLTTLLARTNDAIDTIIRRDENTEETGQYLQPCIEAALNLGCTLSKTTRSQRNSPRCYLSQSTEKVANVIHDTAQNTNRRDNHNTKKSQNVSKNVPPPAAASNKKQFLLQPSNLYSVFPHCYGNNMIQLDDPRHGFKASHRPVSNTFGPAINRGVAQNLMVYNLNPSSGGDSENQSRKKCDLSLRLGPVNIPETEVSSKFIAGTCQKDKKVNLQG